VSAVTAGRSAETARDRADRLAVVGHVAENPGKVQRHAAAVTVVVDTAASTGGGVVEDMAVIYGQRAAVEVDACAVVGGVIKNGSGYAACRGPPLDRKSVV